LLTDVQTKAGKNITSLMEVTKPLKVKGAYSCSCHPSQSNLSYEITPCYLPPYTVEHASL